jgi:hypothetical protein
MDIHELEQSAIEPTFPPKPESHAPLHQVQDHELVAPTGTNISTGGESLGTRRITVENLLNSDAPSSEVPATLSAMAKKAPTVFWGFWRTLINCIRHFTSWNQTKLELTLKDALKEKNDGQIDELSCFMAENIDRLDPRITAAYAGVLEETQTRAAEYFRSQVETCAREKLSSPTIDHNSILLTATNANRVMDAFASGDAPALDIQAPLSLVQKIHAENPETTLVPLDTFISQCPEYAQRLASKENISYMAQTATDDTNGMILACAGSGFNNGILDLIDEGLFEGAQNRAQNIGNFLKNAAVTSNLFYTDGINRHEIPHIILPNGVEILTNYIPETNSVDAKFCESNFCKTTDANGNKKYDHVEYLSYMLDRFEEAYGREDAIRAFKVFVQNFTGSGNTLGVLANTGPYLFQWMGANNLHEIRDRKSTRLNSSHSIASRMPSSA